MSRERIKADIPHPQGIALSRRDNWPSDDDRLTHQESETNIAFTGLNPEQALIEKEEAERDAGIKRPFF